MLGPRRHEGRAPVRPGTACGRERVPARLGIACGRERMSEKLALRA